MCLRIQVRLQQAVPPGVESLGREEPQAVWLTCQGLSPAGHAASCGFVRYPLGFGLDGNPKNDAILRSPKSLTLSNMARNFDTFQHVHNSWLVSSTVFDEGACLLGKAS